MAFKKSIILFTVFMLINCLLSCKVFRSYTPSIEPKNGEISISTLEKFKIGGINQSVCIRGNDINKQILLIVHGGPGDAAMPIINSVNSNLEKDFIVVNWDQRGAGKSYYKFKNGEDITIDTFVNEIHELSYSLLQQFGKKKIYILGHSWGSVLAMKAVQKHPELYYAYIGVGQVVDMVANEKLSYDFTINEAIKKGNIFDERTLLQLDAVDDFSVDWMRSLLTRRKLLLKYGGSLMGQKNYWHLEKHFITSPEYTLKDIVNRIRGSKQSIKAFWPELMKINFMKTATSIDVPIYFLQGTFDCNTPSALLVNYFDIIKAPRKELIWFSKSAHFPQWEEPAKFYEELKIIVDNQSNN